MFKNIIITIFLFLASMTNVLAKIDPKNIIPTDNNLVADSASSNSFMILLTSLKGIIFTLV
ncbi:secreted protein [sediment metagenome]|uniref:Secreted protein n=1 Tax=sediment metagenome TaxID=749907 RepID=D9PKD0_9ZZZZ